MTDELEDLQESVDVDDAAEIVDDAVEPIDQDEIMDDNQSEDECNDNDVS